MLHGAFAQPGAEPELPSAVLHGGGDVDVEADVHRAQALGDVAEAGRDDRRVNDLVGHHLAGILVQDGLHENDFPALRIPVGDGVARSRADDAPLFLELAPGQAQAGLHFLPAHLTQFGAAAAGPCQCEDKEHDADGSCFRAHGSED